IQALASGSHVVMVGASWIYVNAQTSVMFAALLYLYLRHNSSFYFVRNMFLIAMLIALVGYSVYPTAPPRLMPQWGFVDPIQQATHLNLEGGTSSIFLNAYAAVPSMHVCFAMMIGLPMSRLVRHRVLRNLWRAYPLLMVFVVIVTANHYFTDVILGALTAAAAAQLSERLLARARPDVWAFAERGAAQSASA
ncbi:MAG: phosphatase PAP2 family protein, partial [Solirubrobacteraceae bacterium]